MMSLQESQNRLPSQENLFLDYVHRLERHKEGRRAVHIHLSGLRPFNRRRQHSRPSAKSFQTLSKEGMRQRFVRKGSDLVLIYKGGTAPGVGTGVDRSRFRAGPFTGAPFMGARHRGTWPQVAWQ